MKAKWAASVCIAVLALALGAMAQDNGASSEPTLKTRPNDNTATAPQNAPLPQQAPAPGNGQANSSPSSYSAPPSGPPNAIPDGSRFIVRLKDTLDTQKMEQGQHFTAELREELVTPTGLIIPRGEIIKGHVATFERGYTGARIHLAAYG